MTEDEIRHARELRRYGLNEVEIAKFLGKTKTKIREALKGIPKPNKKLSVKEIQNLLDGWR